MLTALVLLWRARLALRNGPLPGRWPIALVLAAAVGLTWWSEQSLLGKTAGVTLLVLLMALKTLELRARRDAMVVFFLGFFLVLTHCLYSQSLLIALHMLVATWGLLTAVVLANMPVGKPPLWRAAKVAAPAARRLRRVSFVMVGILWLEWAGAVRRDQAVVASGRRAATERRARERRQSVKPRRASRAPR